MKRKKDPSQAQYTACFDFCTSNSLKKLWFSFLSPKLETMCRRASVCSRDLYVGQFAESSGGHLTTFPEFTGMTIIESILIIEAAENVEAAALWQY